MRDLFVCDVSRGIPLPSQTIQCIVTSPPYFHQRDYGLPPSVFGGDPACDHLWVSLDEYRPRRASETKSKKQLSNRGTAMADSVVSARAYCSRCGAWRGCLGHEETVDDYVNNIVSIGRELRRVLQPTGVMLMNIGDSFHRENLLGVPWKVAFGLQQDGWILRSDIVWRKPNVIPESVKNRPTRSHEFVFLLTKVRSGYYWNHGEIMEPSVSTHGSGNGFKRENRLSYRDENGPRGSDACWEPTEYRNARDVLDINTRPVRGEKHFAVMPLDLAEWCVRAGSKVGDLVLDPFVGSGTTAIAATRLGRQFVGYDISEEYIALAKTRLQKEGANGQSY